MRTRTMRWRIARRHLYEERPAPKLRWILLLAFLLLAGTSGAAAAGGVYFMSHLPSANRFHIQYTFQDARIYDSRGDLLYNMADLAHRRGGRRVVEPLQDRFDTGWACRGGVNRIPVAIQNATIATEDATFYKNPGFDPQSILRAVYQNIATGHIVSGASTITQQVVRANLLNDQRTLTRKAQEVVLSWEISKKFSKRKILWYYLNSVPYGNTAIGVQAAARIYFGTQACRLDLAQSALLAGLPEAPTLYDPVRHRAYAIARMHTVLDLLWKHGYLHSRSQIGAALNEARHWVFHGPTARMIFPHFVRYAIQQLQAIPGMQQQFYHGIDVYTTIDPRLQNTAQSIVSHQIRGLGAQHVTDGALVSLDLRPQHYGWILAMVGSANAHGRASQINMANSPRQPGSSMKPFNYIWAWAHSDVGPGTTLQDAPIVLPDPGNKQDGGWYAPKNYDHQFHGTVTMRQALANSLNVPAVKVEYYYTSPKNVAKTAATFGMTSLYGDNPGLDCSVCYAVTLGGLSQGTRLVQETAAYGVFATGGRTVPPVAIWKVVQRGTGKVLYCSASCPRGVRPDPSLQRARRQVLDSAHAFEMTDVLSDNNTRCSPTVCEFGLNSPLVLDHPAAAKTGTTNNWTDNWTVGYTPQIVTGVWAGNADRSPMVNVIGITGAAPIWHDFMEASFHILNLPAQPFIPPPNVVRTTQCALPGRAGIGSMAPDLMVGQPTTITSLPLCSVPERGAMPVPCNKYPLTPELAPGTCPPFPKDIGVIPTQSGMQQPFTYTYNPATGIYTYSYANGAVIQSSTPPSQIGFGAPQAGTSTNGVNGVQPAITGTTPSVGTQP